MIDQIVAWLLGSRAWRSLLFFVVGYAIVVVVTLLILVVVIATLPENYFKEGAQVRRSHGVVGRIVRNAIGLVLIILGLVLSLPTIPGQGVLTMLIGLMLVDFPRKRPLERKLLARPRVLERMNRVRAWFGRPPLVR